MSERINMHCPSCGGRDIFIGTGGYLTCSYVDCPEPSIARAVEEMGTGIPREIKDERVRQHEKWGEQNHPDQCWLAILTEEVGEIAEAILDQIFRMSPDKETSVRKELVHAVAVGIAWLECIDRR